MKRLAFGVVAVCIFLTYVAGAAPAGKVAEAGTMTAVRFARAPVVDGVVSPGEWDGALTSSGLLGAFDRVVQETETTMSLGFDDERLYFLFNCRRGNKEWRLQKNARLNDEYDFGDPSVEVWVSPPTLVPETHQNIFNTYPSVFDIKMIPSRGYAAQGWKADWKLGVTESETHYVIEASAPIKDFGFHRVTSGDVWRFLMARTCHGAKPRAQAGWAMTGGFADIGQYPQVRMLDDAPVVQLRGVHTLLSGTSAITLDVVAPRASAAAVTVEARFHPESAFGDNDKVFASQVKLAAGGRERLAYDLDLAAVAPADAKGVRKGYLTVTATQPDGQVLFNQSFAYIPDGWTPQTPVRPADAVVPDVALSALYGPETSQVLVKADIFSHPQKELAASATVTVTDPASGKPLVAETVMMPFVEWYASAAVAINPMPIPVEDFRKVNKARDEREAVQKANLKLKEGQQPKPLPEIPVTAPKTVQVVVKVKDAAGAVLSEATRDVPLLRYQAEWMNNTVGISDQAPPPWTPVHAKDGEASVWNRTLQLDGLGLAAKIVNGGGDQGVAMRLVAVAGGKEQTIQAGVAKLERWTEAAAEWSGAAQAAGLAFTTACRVEFDGFVRNEMTVSPANGAAATVDKLFLEIVLPESEATHFCTTAGGWAATHDETPAYWSSQSTASGMLIGDFVPYILLINSDRGLLWAADHDKGWNHDTDKTLPTQEIIRKDGKVTLRVHFFEIPTTVDKPRTITWHWQAYPAKPLPAGWRATYCSNRPLTPNTLNTYFWTDADWAVLWPYYCSPFPWSMDKSRAELMRTPVTSSHRPSVGSIAHSIGRYRDYSGNTFNGLAVDWGATPGQIGNSDVTASKGPNEFRLWHYQKWVQDARFRSLYVDENYLALEENYLTGNAYWREDGRLQRAYNYMGLRSYFKRLKTMFHQNAVPTPNLWQHVSSGAAYFAWFGDVFFEGENVEPTDLTFDYLEVLPAGRLRSIGSSVIAGGVMTMMCQAERHPTQWRDKHIHQFVGWNMAHDVLPEERNLYPLLVEAGRLWREDVVFTGYWKQGPFATKAADCLVSAHTTPGRALLWVVNTARQDRDVQVTADWRRAGLDVKDLVARNAETGAPIALTADGFAVAVPNRDFVPVLLFKRPSPQAGLTFAASFDHAIAAETAVSCAVITAPRGNLTRVSDGKGGLALSLVDGSVAVQTHLHLGDARGRVTFRAHLPEKANGPLVELGNLSVAMRQTRDGAELTLSQADSSKTAKDATLAAGPLVATGWVDFTLAWADGRASVKAGDATVAEIAVRPTLGLAAGINAGNRATALVFGSRGGYLAIDDVMCWE